MSALGRPRQDPARRPIGALRTHLEYLDSESLEAGLPALLRDLQQACMASAEAVAEKFFPYQGRRRMGPGRRVSTMNLPATAATAATAPRPTRRLRIRHTTRVAYAQPAASSHNEVRMTPLTLPGQTTPDARVLVNPSTPTWSYWDYWGTQVTGFDLIEPHSDLTITATSLVETSPPEPLPEAPDRAEIRRATADSRLLEYLTATGRTTLPQDLVDRAREASEGLSAHGTAVAVSSLVADRVAYVPGATGVHTSAAEAWDQGAGVCQDIAHLTLGMLRALGLPARYVSGYLHPDREAELHRPVAGQSHAWVEYWAGDWTGYDPTNRVPADESHVVVGRGRDYDDVTPHKGIYRGVAGGPPEVTIEFTRVA